MPPSPLAVCRLCQRADDNPEVFGETCQQDGLCIHENCLVSRQGVQPPGFFGFLFPDIHQELQRVAQKSQALSSALHHFRCPLCQDVQTFQEEMFRLGIKIPDRDAAWEEDGAFEEHYQRHRSCDASQCLCPVGREQSEDTGVSCCSAAPVAPAGTHQLCSDIGEDISSWECSDCADTCTGESCS
uniref:PHF7/G2E3-like PHD zinc finger domain-containing protein n=1 Tax=Anas platyrhynchos TaxID=8839 RepID=A0A8B9TMT8_ANAPL